MLIFRLENAPTARETDLCWPISHSCLDEGATQEFVASEVAEQAGGWNGSWQQNEPQSGRCYNRAT